MITEKDLQEAIAECQGQRNPTAATCMKLAAYYTIQDHMKSQTQNIPVSNYSYAPERPAYSGYSYSYNEDTGSEFLKVIRNKDMNEIMSIMDELMNTLHVINPRLYEGVMTKLTL